jgi:hypothetical protein
MVGVFNNLEEGIMNTLLRCVTLGFILLPFSVNAEVMQYTLCDLNEGKTIADAQAWVEAWRPLAKSSGKQYQLRLLTPHAGPERLDQFFIEGSTPTLATYADAWEWWYSDSAAGESNAQLVSVASCAANSIYISTD